MHQPSRDSFTVWLVISLIGGLGIGALVGEVYHGADPKDLQSIVLSCITALAALLAQSRTGQRNADNAPAGTPADPVAVQGAPDATPVETVEVAKDGDA